MTIALIDYENVNGIAFSHTLTRTFALSYGPTKPLSMGSLWELCCPYTGIDWRHLMCVR